MTLGAYVEHIWQMTSRRWPIPTITLFLIIVFFSQI